MNKMTPQYRTMLFCEVFENPEIFSETLSEFGELEEVDLNLLYLLLSAKYGNNPIANNDINQFKLKVWSVTYQYGPTWAKQLEVQKNLRGLTEEDLMQGNKSIYNHAFNPSTAPSTSTLEELEHINDQNTSNMKRGKLEASGLLLDLLETNYTDIFLKKYQNLFKQFVMPEEPLLFISEGEE